METAANMRRRGDWRQSACPPFRAPPHSAVMTAARRRALLGFGLPGLLVCASCRIERAEAGRPGLPAVAASSADSLATAQVMAALRLYYTRLSGRELRVVSRSFWPGATITSIMRAASDAADSVHTVAIADLAGRGRAARECRAGFSDEIARATIATYGPLAQAWVTYRARCGLTRDSTATHYGVDAFLLLQFGGEWRISGLAVTRELRDQPLAHALAP